MTELTESQRAAVRRSAESSIADHWPPDSTAEGRGAALARYRAGTATVEEQHAVAMSAVIFTGGMGVLGCGTLPEQVPMVKAMQREYARLLYGDDQAELVAP